MITYKKITSHEAEDFYHLMKTLDQETVYMLYSPGERQKNLELLISRIEQLQHTSLLIGARNDQNELVGYLSAERTPLAKVSHTAYLVVGILDAYQKMGIGTTFFRELENWAKEKRLHRLELTVIVENEAAVKLYQKMGFVIEGTKKDSIFMNDRYFDEYYMAKLI